MIPKAGFPIKGALCKTPCRAAADNSWNEVKNDPMQKAKYEEIKNKGDPEEYYKLLRDYMRQAPSQGRGKRRLPFAWSKFWEELRNVSGQKKQCEEDFMRKEQFLKWLQDNEKMSFIEAEAIWDQKESDPSIDRMMSHKGELMLPLPTRFFRATWESNEKHGIAAGGQSEVKKPKVGTLEQHEAWALEGGASSHASIKKDGLKEFQFFQGDDGLGGKVIADSKAAAAWPDEPKENKDREWGLCCRIRKPSPSSRNFWTTMVW